MVRLECIGTNDPQSPNILQFKWFKGSTRIDNAQDWTFFQYPNNNSQVTFTSVIISVNEATQQYNGKYTCSVYDSMITINIEQSINVIVEGKQLQHVTESNNYSATLTLILLLLFYSCCNCHYSSSCNSCIYW